MVAEPMSRLGMVAEQYSYLSPAKVGLGLSLAMYWIIIVKVNSLWNVETFVMYLPHHGNLILHTSHFENL